MRLPQVNAPVRLLHDLPHQGLHRGDMGVVKSMWLAPISAVEVEFHPPGEKTECRALLTLEEFEVTGEAEDFDAEDFKVRDADLDN